MFFAKMRLIIFKSIRGGWQNSRVFFNIRMMLAGWRVKKTNFHPRSVWQLGWDIGNNDTV